MDLYLTFSLQHVLAHTLEPTLMINGTLCYLCRWYMHINDNECSVIHLHLDLGTNIGYIHLFQRIKCLTSINGLAHSRNQHIRYKVIYSTARFIIRIKSWIVFFRQDKSVGFNLTIFVLKQPSRYKQRVLHFKRCTNVERQIFQQMCQYSVPLPACCKTSTKRYNTFQKQLSIA